MLSARNIILGSLVLLFVSILVGTIRIMGPPDSDGFAADTYGTHRDGYRAAYELLTEFGVAVERSVSPPQPSLPPSSTLVLWGPHQDLVDNEPAYLARLKTWIESGGRIVVAPPPVVEKEWIFRERPRSLNVRSIANKSLWEILGLGDMDVSQGPPLTQSRESGASTRTNRPNDREVWEELMRSGMGTQLIPTAIVSVTTNGHWSGLQDRIQHLRVPSRGCGQIIVPPGLTPQGEILCKHVNGASWTLAASFPKGRGEVVVIAEPLLLGNGQLAEVDNAVLTYDLLSADHRPVIFDEFYHGLSVRGNPLWLLTRPGASLMVAMCLLALGIGIWRNAVVLGPSLESAPKSRRAIIEYIEAMAQLLTRSRTIRPFLLAESRAGVLRVIGERLGLPPGLHDAGTILATLERRSPDEARLLREALGYVDQAVRKGDSVSSSLTILATQRLFRCL